MKEYTLEEIFQKPISGEWGEELDENSHGVKVIRTTNFTNNGTLDLVNVVERDIDVEKYKSKILRAGDIIIEKSGGSPNQPVGRVVLFDKEDECYFCNNFTSILRPKKGFNSKYLLYLLTNLYVQKRVMKYQNKTTGIINLKLNDYIKGTKVMIPSLEIQQRIVEVLDKSQAIVQKRREQIQACDELIKSQFIEMFGDVLNNTKGWDMKALSEIAELKSGGTPSRQNPEYFMGDIPWITTVALGKVTIDEEDAVEYITKEAIEKSATKLIPANSLLFGTRVGVGKISINKVPMCTNQDIVAIVGIDENRYNQIFLKNVIDSYSEYFNQQKRGATIQGIKSETLKNIAIPTVSIQLQNEFATLVQQVDKLKFEMEQSLKELEDNFASLMQRAFRGELF